MASELRSDFHGDPEPQADSEFQSNSESDFGSDPWSLSLSSTEDIQDMRPGSPDSSGTWLKDIHDMRPGSPDSLVTLFEDIQDMRPGSPDSLVALFEDIQDMRPGSPDSLVTLFEDIQDTRPDRPSHDLLWTIAKVTPLDKFLYFPNTVPRIYLEGIGTAWIPTVEAVRTRATDLDAETVRAYIPGECWLPHTWSVHCARYSFKSSTDKYTKATLITRSLVSLEELDGGIGARNIIIPPSFNIWRKFATVQNAILREGQGKYSEPEDTEMASCMVTTPRRSSL